MSKISEADQRAMDNVLGPFVITNVVLALLTLLVIVIFGSSDPSFVLGVAFFCICVGAIVTAMFARIPRLARLLASAAPAAIVAGVVVWANLNHIS